MHTQEPSSTLGATLDENPSFLMHQSADTHTDAYNDKSGDVYSDD
jgi:hypothetical protein